MLYLAVPMSLDRNTILPSPDVLNNLECGKFVLSNLAAKRAKQIKDGAPPLVRTDSNHPLSIALAEIAAGKIKPTLTVDPDAMAVVDSEILDSSTPELGILLPALEESELIDSGLLGIEDHEEDHDHDHDGETASLTDLLEGEHDEEVEVVAAEGDNLSLSDIAEEEESAADEDDDSQV